MKRFKRWMAAALAACTVLGMTACGNTAETPSGSGEASSTGGYADKITIGRPMDSDNLDPVTAEGNQNIWMFELMMEGLVKTDDSGNEIEPCLADTWEISDDGTVYTFHLKDGVKFANGDDVTIEDWIWSLERARDTEESEWNFTGAPIADVAQGADEHTLVITLNAPCAAFLSYCSMFNMSVQDKSYFEEVGEEAYTASPMGTGAYMLSEWKQGESMTFVANPNYHGEAPKTPELDFVVISDDSSRLMQLQAGAVDIMTYVPTSAVAPIQADSSLTFLAPESTEMKYVMFNVRDGIMGNQKVRQALRYATDKQEIIDMVYDGNAVPAVSCLAETSEYLNTDIQDVSYDVDTAKSMLAEAGYPNGMDITLMYRSGDEAYEQIAVTLQSQWAKVGVNVTLDPEEKAVMTEKRDNGEYQACLWMWTDDVSDPSEFMDFFLDPSKTDGLHTGYSNATCTELEKAALVEGNVETRKEQYAQVQQIVFDETPLITLCYVPFTVATTTAVDGFVQTPLGIYRFENLTKTVG